MASSEEHDAHISMLVDMGFSPGQAAEALRNTNNDVNQAIAYLFDDPIEVDNATENASQEVTEKSEIGPIAEVPSVEHYDTVEITNPSQIPNLDRFQQWYDSDEDRVEFPSIAPAASRIDNLLYCERPEVSDTSDELLAIQPSVAVVRRAGYLENYVFPLLSIFAHIPQVSGALLSPVDEDAAPDSVAYVKSVQRLVYFLSHYTKTRRWFMWGAEVTDALPRDFRADLANKIESVDEVILRSYESFVHHFRAAGCTTSLEPIMMSSVESEEDNQQTGVYVLEIEMELRGMDVYHAMNSLFWQNSLGGIRYRRVAPVVTFHLAADDEQYSVHPFTVLDEFRPHIYAEPTTVVLRQMDAAKEKYEKEFLHVTSELLLLNFFEGKRVGLLLEASAKHLQKAGMPLDDLETLCMQVAEEMAEQNRRQNEIRLLIDACDCKNPANVVAKAGPLPVYRLRGLILLDFEYYYTVGSQWYYFRALVGLEYSIYDYVSRPMEFEDIQDEIRVHTGRSTGGLIMVYAADSEEAYGDAAKELPRLKEQFDADEHAFASSVEEERARVQRDAEDEEEESENDDSDKDKGAHDDESGGNGSQFVQEQDSLSQETQNSTSLVDF